MGPWRVLEGERSICKHLGAYNGVRIERIRVSSWRIEGALGDGRRMVWKLQSALKPGKRPN